MELSQEKLEEMVNGKAAPPKAIFYEQATLDRTLSEEAGRRIYTSRVFIKLTVSGTSDWQPYAAQPADIEKYKEEYQYFLNNRQGERIAGIDIIPGLTLAHKQELLDTGFTDLIKLAKANSLPEHLQYAQRSAMVLSQTLKDIKNAEEPSQSGSTAEKQQALPSHDRQNNGDHVRRQFSSGVQSSLNGNFNWP